VVTAVPAQRFNPVLQPIPLPNERMTPAKKNLTFNDLEHWLNARRVTEVECLVPDLTGVARGKILPRGKFTEDRGMRLPQAIVGMGVTGEFPESGPYYDVVDPTDKDMQLRPDPSTVRIVPWATDPHCAGDPRLF
jgi:glutamine synthetase